MSESKEAPCVQLMHALKGQKIKCVLRDKMEAVGELTYLDEEDLVLIRRDNYFLNDPNPKYTVQILSICDIQGVIAEVREDTLGKFLGYKAVKKEAKEQGPAFVKDMGKDAKKKETRSVEGAQPKAE